MRRRFLVIFALILVVCCLFSSMPAFAGATTQKRSGTASVWCGIPALGWATIDTPWKATFTVDGNKYTNVRITAGTSRKVGFAKGKWEHISSWVDYYSSTKNFEVNAKGIFTYDIFGGELVTTPQTFLKRLNLKKV